MRAMEGVLWVNGRQKRLAEISGRLTRPVKFGGGLLGHLDAGGHFYVKQEEVQPGYWELAVLDVDMKGKALFFKTIGVQEEMKRSMFRRVRDDLTAAQGANLLYQQVRTTSKISFKTEPAVSSHCRRDGWRLARLSGTDDADTALVARCKTPLHMRSWFPPFAECTKDGAATAFSVSTKLEAPRTYALSASRSSAGRTFSSLS